MDSTSIDPNERFGEGRLRRLEEKLRNELMDDEERCELESLVKRLKKRAVK